MSAKPKRPSAVVTQRELEAPKNKKKISTMQIAFILLSFLLIIAMVIPYFIR